MCCVFVLSAFSLFCSVSCPRVKRLCVFRKALYKFELLLLLLLLLLTRNIFQMERCTVLGKSTAH